MKKTKKILAIVMLCVMMCGVTVFAATTEHSHRFAVRDWVCYNSFTASSHQYPTGIYYNYITGTTETTYSTCETVIYKYKGMPYCTVDGCNAKTGNYEYMQELRHMKCGQ